MVLRMMGCIKCTEYILFPSCTHTHTHRVLEMVLMRMVGCRKNLKIEKWRQEELHGFLEALKRNI
jgi:hypothetical protein